MPFPAKVRRKCTFR